MRASVKDSSIAEGGKNSRLRDKKEKKKRTASDEEKGRKKIKSPDTPELWKSQTKKNCT